jgi:ATP synthase protein I
MSNDRHSPESPRPESPSPESKTRGNASGGMFGAWVQAEKLLQIAFVLPGSAAIGWLLGAWTDRRFHQSWMTVTGILLGSLAGLVYTIQMAVAAERSSDPRQAGSREADQGGSFSRDDPENGTPPDRP